MSNNKTTSAFLGIFIVVAVVAIVLAGGAVWMQHKSPRQTIQNGKTTVYEEELNFYSHKDKICGVMDRPADADPKEKLPLVIYCHGLGSSYAGGSAALRKYIAGLGYAAYGFDFRGGGPKSKSDGSTLEMSYDTEIEDLEAVLKRIKRLNGIDHSRVYLMGHSQGAVVASIVGCHNPDKVRGMILLAPSYNAGDLAMKIYPRLRNFRDSTWYVNMYVGPAYFKALKNFKPYDRMENFTGPVLLVHGTEDEFVPVAYSDKAAKIFPNVQYERLEGVGHAFTGNAEKPMVDLVTAYLKEQLAESGLPSGGGEK